MSISAITAAASAATPIWPIMMLSQGIFSIVNTISQHNLAKKNQEFQLQLEENRKIFQREIFEKTAKLQREIAFLNHNLRLTEQKQAFENTVQQIQFQYFMQNWPLITPPFVMREETVLQNFCSGQPRVGLRVILTKSVNPLYNKYVNEIVEHSLFKFLNKNYSNASNYPVFFYGGGWKNPTGGGGAVNSNLHYALKNLPTLIIDPNVVNNILSFDIAVWGLGVGSFFQDTLFEIPFEKRIDKNIVDEDYYLNFANTLQMFMNYTVGWIADTYHMIEYDQIPLLPNIILSHRDQNEDWTFLKDYFAQEYKAIYDYVLGKQSLNVNGHKVSLSETKVFDIPTLSLNYSHSANELVKECSASFAKDCIRDSMSNWLMLHGRNPDKYNDSYLLSEICKLSTSIDIPYLNALKQAYVTLRSSGEQRATDLINNLNQRIVWLR